MRYYKNDECKRILLQRNAKSIAEKLIEISEAENLSISGYGTQAIGYMNLIKRLDDIKNAAQKLCEAAAIDVNDPIDSKDFSVVNALVMYVDCIREIKSHHNNQTKENKP